jgi:hypothetical protein
MDMLKWLENWYKSYCDGNWEHSYENIRIRTVDNPGWSVEIKLIETSLEDKDFEKINIDNGDDDWIICWVDEGKFRGCGDTDKLSAILEIFKNWSES